MQLLRMTTRKLMIAVAIIATVILVLMLARALLTQLDGELRDAYGSGGKFDLERQIANELTRADNAIRQGDFAEAEARYRSVFKLDSLLRSKLAAHNWTAMYDQTRDADIGIADAVASQGRNAEAERLYRSSLAAREKGFGRENFQIAEVLERYATFLRTTDRVLEAKKLETRALRILDHYIESKRHDDQSTYWKDLVVRAQAIRTRPDQ